MQHDRSSSPAVECPSERSIFIAALEIEDAAGRAGYVATACGSDGALRERIDALLASHAAAGDFMRAPAAGVRAGLLDDAMAEGPGARIGPYKLLERLGEGGMGVVYMAEQEHPVRRRVALKIIKPGMDSRQVIARFEAERQALAMMDHRNIAKVLDAGATPTGRPYFVMELVHGSPITRYCDDYRLTLSQRLELFTAVCRAVQHAHQKGVIHRDLKPSNVLVTMYDGEPVPKVIDFGVAKAVEQPLTDRTLFTRYGVLVGTIEYMAPEQAEMSALGVDTRSDVYSLGVLLYELLTGTTPLERERLRDAAFLDMLRLVREDEPPAPSTRLSSSGDAITTIAASRQVESHKLTRLVRGELDWIVMRCLEKDRTRRYETADALAEDVRRYLQDEPVAAGPPRASYRLRKFARRNRGLLASAAAVAAALVLGTALATYGLVRARVDRKAAVEARDAADRQRQIAQDNEKRALASEKKISSYYTAARTQIANAEAVNRFLQGMFTAPAFGRARADTTVRELLDRASESLERQPHKDERTQAAVHHALGQAYTGLGLYEAAHPHLAEALDTRRRIHGESHPDVAQSLSSLAYWSSQQGDFAKAEQLHREVLAMRRKLLGAEHPTVADSLESLAFSLSQMNKVEEAQALADEALAIRYKQSGVESVAVAGALQTRAVTLKRQGKLEEAEQVARQSVEMFRKFKGNDSLDLSRGMHNLGSILLKRNDLKGAAAAYREAVDIRLRTQGHGHPDVLDGLKLLADTLVKLGDNAGADAVRVERLKTKLVITNEKVAAKPDDPDALWRRADVYGRIGDFNRAAADLRKAVEHPDVPISIAFDCATLHLYLGDEQTYRRLSRYMLKRYENADNAHWAELGAKLCMFTASLDPDELHRCERINARCLADPQATPWLGTWYRVSTIITAYRGNRYDAALGAAAEAYRWSKTPLHPKQQVTALCFTAMAHHRLGNVSQAQKDLAEAKRLLDTEPELRQPPPGKGDFIVWQEIIPLHIHLREAQALIEGPATRPAR